MPDILTLCKDIEMINAMLANIIERVHRIESNKQEQGSGTATSPSAQATPPTQAAAGGGASPTSPTPPPLPQPDKIWTGEFVRDDPVEIPADHVVELRDKKRKQGSMTMEDRIEEAQLNLDIRNAQVAAQKAMEEMDDFEKQARETNDILNRAEDKQVKADIKAEVDKIREEFKAEAEKLKKGMESKQKTFESGAMDNIMNMFGIRMIRKVAPEFTQPMLDLASMANNVSFMDRKVEAQIRKSIANKVASGDMTEAQASEAGGFFSGEVKGKQYAGGVWMALYAMKNFDKVVEKVHAIAESIDTFMSINGGKYKGMPELDKMLTEVTSIKKSSKKTDDMIGDRAALGWHTSTEQFSDIFTKYRETEMNQDKMKLAFNRYFKRKKEQETWSLFRKGWSNGDGPSMYWSVVKMLHLD